MTDWLLTQTASGVSVRIRNDRIAEAGVDLRPEADEVLDCAVRRFEPGRVNAHNHLYSGLAPLGMASPPKPPKMFIKFLLQSRWRRDRSFYES